VTKPSLPVLVVPKQEDHVEDTPQRHQKIETKQDSPL
jgi:hypothetical protein